MTRSESRAKRALYRARHRGTKEMDLVLGGFADAELDAFCPNELSAFEELLTMPDPDIDRWVHGAEPPAHLKTMLERIRRHHGLQS